MQKLLRRNKDVRKTHARHVKQKRYILDDKQIIFLSPRQQLPAT